MIPRLHVHVCVYSVDTRKVEINLVQAVGSLHPNSAEGKLKEITNLLTRDTGICILEELVPVLTQ